MTSRKQCLKCGHTAQFEAEQPLACPSCGAVYAKVEQALRDGQAPRPQPVVRTPTTRLPTTEVDHHAFATVLREESIYPTFRTVVKIAYWIGVLAAICIALGGVMASFSAGLGALAGGIAVGALVFVFAKVAKEMSLMLADLSDATVRTAARSEASRSQP
ncbi:hypothetical protein [Delftia sp. WSY_7]|uniref:hypothetical protein n=1 Tax=Delftia sp. WSY_7 TaxID=3367202 RepID=UPI00370C4B39